VAGTDRRDFEAVYSAHATRFRVVAANALRMAGLSQHAEDVVQKAVEDLWRNPPEVVEDWEPLFIATIKRRAIDLARKADFRHADQAAGPRASTDASQGEAEDWHTARLESGRSVTSGDYQHRDDPELSVERAHHVEAMRAAIARLPSPDKEIVSRIKLDGETGKAVGVSLGISQGRVSQILKRGLQRLAADTELREVS